MDVALATCKILPEPDPDAAPLLQAAHAAGLDVAPLAWDDPDADWSAPRLTLLRSTWNYPRHAETFVAWAERVARSSALWNPLSVVRWNVHKGYLLDLERAGVPVAPTELVRRGDPRPLRAILSERGWSDVVVKPAVSAASYRTMRVATGNLDAGEAHLRDLVAERDTLVQRYLPSVEDHGERALVHVDGKLTHAVCKSPRFDGEDESVSDAVPIAPEERELAERAVAAVDGDPLYARIDVAPGPDGVPVIMELELIEPSLFFVQGPEALERMVAALTRLLSAGRG
jgi:glutathione synthase/RimK-type ligase-like ATP-grasp enzyme